MFMRWLDGTPGDDWDESYFLHAYSQGFRIGNARPVADVYVIERSWFARVILRRKPRVITVYEAAAMLAQRSWEAERRLVDDLFKDRILK